MKKIRLRAAIRALGLLAALHFLDGCAAKLVSLKEPVQVAGRLDLGVTPEERSAFERDLAQSKGRGPTAARALYFLGLAELQAGRVPEAGKFFQRVAAEHAGSGWDLAGIYMMGQSLEKMNDFPRAFVQYQRLVRPPSPLPGSGEPGTLEGDLDRQARKAAARLIAEVPWSEADLAQLIAHPAAEEFQPQLHLKRLQVLVADKRTDEAFAGIEEYYRRFPALPYQADLERLAKEADKATPVDARAVGLLLPFSGPQAAYGLQARQGAELMLEQVNAGLPEDRRLRLLAEDEGSTTATAQASAKKLIADLQVIGVVGPMTSDASAAVLPLASSRRTPLLSPGAIRSDLKDAGPYFFRNCVTLEKQAVAMADHALNELRVTRVACLYPDDGYGMAMAAAFAARVSELAGTVVMSLTYSAGSRDFKDYMVALGGVNPTQLKDADTAEKRDQQKEVEGASTKIGRILLELKASLEAASATAVSREEAELVADYLGSSTGAYLPLSFPARVAVVDFAASSSAARYNMGRYFADRFYRVLGQLEEVVMLPPDQAARWLSARGMTPESLNPSTAAELARALGADFFLGGTATDLVPDWAYLREAAAGPQGREARQARADMELFGRHEVFQVTAQLIDARSTVILSTQSFQASKLRPPLPNPSGIQALYLPGSAAEAVQAASAMKFCDFKVRLLGGDKWIRPELLKHDALDALDDARFTTGFFPESSSETVRHFVEAYKRRYAAAPSLLSAQAYDAAGMVLSLLVSGAAATRQELRLGLLNMSAWDGVSGRTDFAGRQDAVKKIPILRVNAATQALEQVQ